VILGHLVPAGTGFKTYQESEVRIKPEALVDMAREKERVLTKAFPLLESAEGGNGSDGKGAKASSDAAVGGE
jgi:DNA-directed RNA polymerase subunit beta'